MVSEILNLHLLEVCILLNAPRVLTSILLFQANKKKNKKIKTKNPADTAEFTEHSPNPFTSDWCKYTKVW